MGRSFDTKFAPARAGSPWRRLSSRLLSTLVVVLSGATARAYEPSLGQPTTGLPVFAEPYVVNNPTGSPYVVLPQEGSYAPASNYAIDPNATSYRPSINYGPNSGASYGPGIPNYGANPCPNCPCMENGDLPPDGSVESASQGLRGDLATLFAGPELGPAPCRNCPKRGVYLFHNYSSWRGVSDGSGNNNNGFAYGFNFGTRLGKLSDATGIAGQVGASYGFYDLNGRASGFANGEMQEQVFVTAGLFRKADTLTNFSFGVAWDGMFNDRFGQYAVSPFLSQIRGQVAYALGPRHEIGVWGTMRMSGDSENVNGKLDYRAVNQYNFFWHHTFAFGGDGWTWIGFPDHTKLGSAGSLGDYTFGGMLTAPLSPRWTVFTDLQYMKPSAHPGANASMEESFSLSLGLAFYPGRNARALTVSGDCWMPYFPVANNGSFIVDTNRTF